MLKRTISADIWTIPVQLSRQPFQCQMREKQPVLIVEYFMGDGSALWDSAYPPPPHQ